MYSIYADGVCIYNDVAPVESLKVIDPRLILEDSSAGELSMTLPPENVGYSLIKRMSTTITVKREGEEIWEGRVLTEAKDFYKQRQLVCEGELAYLNDTYQTQRVYENVTPYTFIEAILSIHNGKVDGKRRFYVGTVDDILGAGVTVGTFTTDFQKTIDVFNNLISTYGCHIKIRKDTVNGEIVRKIDIFKTVNSTANQKIEFGENLFDYTESYDMTELATVVLPLGSVTAQAGEKTIGNEVTITKRWGTYYDGNTTPDPNNPQTIDGAYCTAVVDLVSIDSISTAESTKTVYISLRQSNAFMMYCFLDGSGNVVTIKKSNTGLGFTDMVESATEVPIGAVTLLLGGFGDDIPMRLNKQRDVSNDFDTYVTVESVNDGSLYVTAKPKNRFLSDISNVASNRLESTEPITLETGNWVFSATVPAYHKEHIKAQLLTLNADGTIAGYGSWTYLPYTFSVASSTIVKFLFERDNAADINASIITNPQLESGSYPTYYEDPIGPLQAHGWIEKLVTWDDVTEPAELLRLAEDYLANRQFDGMQLEVKAIDMKLMGASVDAIDILDEVQVVSKPHGLNRMFPVSRLEIPLADPENMTFTLNSKPSQTLYSDGGSIDSSLSAQLAAAPTMSETLAAAKKNASEQIRKNDRGVISFMRADDGTMREIRITNTADWSAVGVTGWKINYAGFGFFGHGFDQPADITIVGPNGGIVANSITTGTMVADLIKGGTLTLGGFDNTNGVLVVKDYIQNTVCRLDKDGGYIRGEFVTDGTNPDTGAFNILDIQGGLIQGQIRDGNVDRDAFKMYATTSYLEGATLRGVYIVSDNTAIRGNRIFDMTGGKLWLTFNDIVVDIYGENANPTSCVNGTTYIDLESQTLNLTTYHGLVIGNTFTNKTPVWSGGKTVRVLGEAGSPIDLHFNEWGRLTSVT